MSMYQMAKAIQKTTLPAVAPYPALTAEARVSHHANHKNSRQWKLSDELADVGFSGSAVSLRYLLFLFA
jgi:hypothetical protein